MKILSEEDKIQHRNTVLIEGLKGCVVGSIAAVGLILYVKRRNPLRFSQMSFSIKAAMFAMPTVSAGAFFADEGSYQYDREVHQSDYIKKQEDEKLARWQSLSTADKAFTVVNDNKYKIIISAWAASMYGSWKYVNRDKIMSNSQKIVQARMYAQAITVVLLLGTILLSLHEQELKKKEPTPVPEWKRYLEEKHKMEADK